MWVLSWCWFGCALCFCFGVCGCWVGFCCLFWINELAAPLLQFAVMALFMHCQCFWEHWQSRARCFFMWFTIAFLGLPGSLEPFQPWRQEKPVGVWFDFLAMRWNYEMDATIVTFRGRSSFFFSSTGCVWCTDKAHRVCIYLLLLAQPAKRSWVCPPWPVRPVRWDYLAYLTRSIFSTTNRTFVCVFFFWACSTYHRDIDGSGTGYGKNQLDGFGCYEELIWIC